MPDEERPEEELPTPGRDGNQLYRLSWRALGAALTRQSRKEMRPTVSGGVAWTGRIARPSMTGPISLQEWRLEHAQKAVASRAATPCYALSCICTVKLNSPVTVEIRWVQHSASSTSFFRVYRKINGCAFCIDIHWRDLMKLDVDPRHQNTLGGWREAPLKRHRAGFTTMTARASNRATARRARSSAPGRQKGRQDQTSARPRECRIGRAGTADV